MFGEIMTTCVKAQWMIDNGEAALAPESRPTTLMTMAKHARVEYHPLGVIGVIAPWNYPFHNMYNHIISGLFAGNAVVTKVRPCAWREGGGTHTPWPLAPAPLPRYPFNRASPA
jgi:acyl-CoA reductase-like NAD-dependent aldehyde dehydrogenase